MKIYTREGAGYAQGDRVQDLHPRRVALNGSRRGTVLDVERRPSEFFPDEMVVMGVRVEWDDQPSPVVVKLGTLRKLDIVERVGEIKTT